MPGYNSPLVSVVIPFLNGGDWLAEAIESVLAQTCTNWEAIVVDDGSEEVHSKVAKDYSYKYPGKIKYAHHAGHVNKGVTVSRNLGISLSAGLFIAFLDADDCWLPDKLDYQLKIFDEHPQAQMICEASRFWYSWNNVSADDVDVKVGVQPDKLYKPPILLKNLYPLGEGAPPCPTGIIIRRQAFNRSGGFEPAFAGVYQLYEDQAFLCKIYLKEDIFISGKANNMYRKRAGSLTESANDLLHYKMVRLFYLNWLQNYLNTQQVTDESIFKLIEAAKKKLDD